MTSDAYWPVWHEGHEPGPDAGAALAALDRVRSIHEPIWRHRFCPPGDKEQFCAHDGLDWPCPTVRAIDGPEGTR